MNVLVTGSNGQLGLTLMNMEKTPGLRFLYTDVRVSDGVSCLDITDSTSVCNFLSDNDIDVVLNFAAYTDVERAEIEEDLAFRVNAEAVGCLAEAVKKTRATLVHISTDYVFDGSAGVPYGEEAEPAPLSAYGRSKLAGERALLASQCRSILIRTSWLYSPYGKNFVKTIISRGAESGTLKVVSDQLGSPTFAEDLAGFIITVLTPENIKKTGVYNYTDEGVCSWFELAGEACALAGVECDVIPCKTGEYPVKAMRPAFSVLDKSKVKDTFGIIIPHWKDSLKRCIAML